MTPTTPARPRKTHAVVALLLLIGAVLIFIAAFITGAYIDSRPKPALALSLATVGLILLGSLVYLPMLLASALVALSAIRRRRGTVLAACTLGVAVLCLVPATPLFVLTIGMMWPG